MDVRPRPQFVGSWKDGEVRHIDIGQRLVFDVPALGEFLLREYDECDPWPETSFGQVRRSGSVPPAESFVVELDVRQMIGFEIGDPVARLHAENRALIDANNIAGPEQGYFAVDGDCIGPSSELVSLGLELHIDTCTN